MRKSRQAFTLIELLVVMGIILVLMSLLISGLGGAMKVSNKTECENNVRSLLMAMRQYSMDDDGGRLPYANWGPGGTYDPGAPAAGWLYQYPNVGKTPDDMRTGSLWKYVGNETVYHCPLHKPPYHTGCTDNITSYLINGAVCGYGSQAPSYSPNAFSAKGRDPSNEMLMFECAVDGGSQVGGGAGSSFFWNDGSSYPTENVLSNRHGTGATVGFMDFHVEYYDLNSYLSQLSLSPGPLWCNPGSANGH